MTVAFFQGGGLNLGPAGGTGNFTVPSNTPIGSVMMAVMTVVNVGNGLSGPLGWVTQVNASDQWVGSKIVVASDLGSTVQWYDSDGENYAGVWAIYTTDLNTPIDVSSYLGGVTAPSVTTTAPNDLVVCLFADAAGPSTGLTTRVNVNGSGYVGDFTQASAGATPAQTGSSASGATSATYALFTSTPPAAPTLDSPGNGAYITAPVTTTSTFNSTDGTSQNAYAERIKAPGASAYNYYNASTNATQSTIVWNPDSVAPGAEWSVTLPTTVAANGTTWNWSTASQTTSGLQGQFASDFTFNAQAGPNLTVNAPNGTVTEAQPTIYWTTTPAQGDVQTAYQVIVESGTYGTTPGSGTSVWNSEVISSNAQAAQVGVALSNATQYRAFVQVTETGGTASDWQYVTFTVTFDPPAQPTLTVTQVTDPSTGLPSNQLLVQGHDNLLTADDASFEGGLGTWVGDPVTAISQTDIWAVDGSYSMKLRATAAGPISAQTANYEL